MDHLWYFSGLRGSLILNPLHLQRNHQLVYFSCSLQYSTSSPAYTGGSYMHGTWDGVSWLRCECWPTCASLWWGRGQWDKQCPGSGRLKWEEETELTWKHVKWIKIIKKVKFKRVHKFKFMANETWMSRIKLLLFWPCFISDNSAGVEDHALAVQDLWARVSTQLSAHIVVAVRREVWHHGLYVTVTRLGLTCVAVLSHWRLPGHGHTQSDLAGGQLVARDACGHVHCHVVRHGHVAVEARDPDTWHVVLTCLTGGDGSTASRDHVTVMQECHAVNVGGVGVQALVTQTQCHAELLTVTRAVTRHVTRDVGVPDTRTLIRLLDYLKTAMRI